MKVTLTYITIEQGTFDEVLSRSNAAQNIRQARRWGWTIEQGKNGSYCIVEPGAKWRLAL